MTPATKEEIVAKATMLNVSIKFPIRKSNAVCRLVAPAGTMFYFSHDHLEPAMTYAVYPKSWDAARHLFGYLVKADFAGDFSLY